MADCTLCALAAGSDHVLRLYEDDHAIVVLRLRDGRPDQVLAVPRRHAATLPELGSGLEAHLLAIGTRATRSLEDAGVNLGHPTAELLEGAGHVHVRLTAVAS